MALSVMLASGALPATTLLSSFHEGNSVFLRISDGSAQIEWLSESSFRFTRRWDGSFTKSPEANGSISLKINDTAESLKIATRYLLLTIMKRGVTAHVAEPDGATIMADASEPELRDGAVAWERLAAPQVRFYGLGARDDPAVDLRGTRTDALKPFLMSSAGYAEYHVAAGTYSFDLASSRADRYRIEARGASKVDYYFFFGPTPKEILEQYLSLDGPMERLSPSKFQPLRPSEKPPQAALVSKPSLAAAIHGLINGSMSGVLLPAFAIDPFQRAPDAVRRRAIQLGSVTPIVISAERDWIKGTWRGELTAYFTTYAEEARERGLPMIHPLPMQFPRDPQAAAVSDQFMLGDELLIAPIHDERNSRPVYLPMGIWTRLSDNQLYQGRRTITVEAGPGELLAFSRNGAILPLGSDPMKLHYFPRLGGEFFLFESDLGEYSQAHAGPAGDFMRLEIESKKDRSYEWIVHHLDRPRKIREGSVEYALVESPERLGAGAWFYDAVRKNLHVRVVGRAGGDEIVNISF